MERLVNTIRPYAWGSRTAIAALQGRPPSEGPEAELWMGAHPSAPSQLGDETLLARIERDPERSLGAACLQRFGLRLPYLFKVLAADEPLSLQAHPSIEQAEAGFAREERASVPRDAEHRNYRDRNHKPELLCALGPFVALCGFRAVEQTRAFFTTLAVPGLLALDLDDLRGTFRTIMTTDVSALVGEAAAACARVTSGPFAREAEWGARLAAKYPGDRGVIGALLLNLVFLSEGEAIYLPAGNLHAYLHGVGVEIMASSDNVLRGGMTPKHVDVDELMRVLDFTPMSVAKVHPTRRGALDVWLTPAEEFELARARGNAEMKVHAPLIVLCTEGSLRADDGITSETLTRGDSVFVPGSAERLRLEGDGTAYVASAVTQK
jgi:mannose-6-phosphate isomerase